MLTFSDAQFKDFNERAALIEDARSARDIRAFRPNLVSHLSEWETVTEVTVARHAARRFGPLSDQLTTRFIMIHVLMLPKFWEHSEAFAILNASTGTPEIRFGDICAVIKQAAVSLGDTSEIWW